MLTYQTGFPYKNIYLFFQFKSAHCTLPGIKLPDINAILTNYTPKATFLH